MPAEDDLVADEEFTSEDEEQNDSGDDLRCVIVKDGVG